LLCTPEPQPKAEAIWPRSSLSPFSQGENVPVEAEAHARGDGGAAANVVNAIAQFFVIA
jgi:hypothetical protein